MLRALVIALLALAVAASSAQAGWRTDRALAIAQVVMRPACGQLALAFRTATQDGSTEDDAWAWAGDCTIYLNSDDDWQDFEPFCTTILHEAGHAAGMGHSSNRRSVMYPYLRMDRATSLRTGQVTWPGTDKRCRERGLPFLRLHWFMAR